MSSFSPGDGNKCKSSPRTENFSTRDNSPSSTDEHFEDFDIEGFDKLLDELTQDTNSLKTETSDGRTPPDKKKKHDVRLPPINGPSSGKGQKSSFKGRDEQEFRKHINMKKDIKSNYSEKQQNTGIGKRTMGYLNEELRLTGADSGISSVSIKTSILSSVVDTMEVIPEESSSTQMCQVSEDVSSITPADVSVNMYRAPRLSSMSSSHSAKSRSPAPDVNLSYGDTVITKPRRRNAKSNEDYHSSPTESLDSPFDDSQCAIRRPNVRCKSARPNARRAVFGMFGTSRSHPLSHTEDVSQSNTVSHIIGPSPPPYESPPNTGATCGSGRSANDISWRSHTTHGTMRSSLAGSTLFIKDAASDTSRNNAYSPASTPASVTSSVNVRPHPATPEDDVSWIIPLSRPTTPGSLASSESMHSLLSTWRGEAPCGRIQNYATPLESPVSFESQHRHSPHPDSPVSLGSSEFRTATDVSPIPLSEHALNKLLKPIPTQSSDSPRSPSKTTPSTTSFEITNRGSVKDAGLSNILLNHTSKLATKDLSTSSDSSATTSLSPIVKRGVRSPATNGGPANHTTKKLLSKLHRNKRSDHFSETKLRSLEGDENVQSSESSWDSPLSENVQCRVLKKETSRPCEKFNAYIVKPPPSPDSRSVRSSSSTWDTPASESEQRLKRKTMVPESTKRVIGRTQNSSSLKCKTVPCLSEGDSSSQSVQGRAPNSISARIHKSVNSHIEKPTSPVCETILPCRSSWDMINWSPSLDDVPAPPASVVSDTIINSDVKGQSSRTRGSGDSRGSMNDAALSDSVAGNISKTESSSSISSFHLHLSKTSCGRSCGSTHSLASPKSAVTLSTSSHNYVSSKASSESTVSPRSCSRNSITSAKCKSPYSISSTRDMITPRTSKQTSASNSPSSSPRTNGRPRASPLKLDAINNDVIACKINDSFYVSEAYRVPVNAHEGLRSHPSSPEAASYCAGSETHLIGESSEPEVSCRPLSTYLENVYPEVLSPEHVDLPPRTRSRISTPESAAESEAACRTYTISECGQLEMDNLLATTQLSLISSEDSHSRAQTPLPSSGIDLLASSDLVETCGVLHGALKISPTNAASDNFPYIDMTSPKDDPEAALLPCITQSKSAGIAVNRETQEDIHLHTKMLTVNQYEHIGNSSISIADESQETCHATLKSALVSETSENHCTSLARQEVPDIIWSQALSGDSITESGEPFTVDTTLSVPDTLEISFSDSPLHVHVMSTDSVELNYEIIPSEDPCASIQLHQSARALETSHQVSDTILKTPEIEELDSSATILSMISGTSKSSPSSVSKKSLDDLSPRSEIKASRGDESASSRTTPDSISALEVAESSVRTKAVEDVKGLENICNFTQEKTEDRKSETPPEQNGNEKANFQTSTSAILLNSKKVESSSILDEHSNSPMSPSTSESIAPYKSALTTMDVKPSVSSLPSVTDAETEKEDSRAPISPLHFPKQIDTSHNVENMSDTVPLTAVPKVAAPQCKPIETANDLPNAPLNDSENDGKYSKSSLLKETSINGAPQTTTSECTLPRNATVVVTPTPLVDNMPGVTPTSTMIDVSSSSSSSSSTSESSSRISSPARDVSSPVHITNEITDNSDTSSHLPTEATTNKSQNEDSRDVLRADENTCTSLSANLDESENHLSRTTAAKSSLSSKRARSCKSPLSAEDIIDIVGISTAQKVKRAFESRKEYFHKSLIGDTSTSVECSSPMQMLHVSSDIPSPSSAPRREISIYSANAMEGSNSSTVFGVLSDVTSCLLFTQAEKLIKDMQDTLPCGSKTQTTQRESDSSASGSKSDSLTPRNFKSSLDENSHSLRSTPYCSVHPPAPHSEASTTASTLSSSKSSEISSSSCHSEKEFNEFLTVSEAPPDPIMCQMSSTLNILAIPANTNFAFPVQEGLVQKGEHTQVLGGVPPSTIFHKAYEFESSDTENISVKTGEGSCQSIEHVDDVDRSCMSFPLNVPPRPTSHASSKTSTNTCKSCKSLKLTLHLNAPDHEAGRANKMSDARTSDTETCLIAEMICQSETPVLNEGLASFNDHFGTPIQDVCTDAQGSLLCMQYDYASVLNSRNGLRNYPSATPSEVSDTGSSHTTRATEEVSDSRPSTSDLTDHSQRLNYPRYSNTSAEAHGTSEGLKLTIHLPRSESEVSQSIATSAIEKKLQIITSPSDTSQSPCRILSSEDELMSRSSDSLSITSHQNALRDTLELRENICSSQTLDRRNELSNVIPFSSLVKSDISSHSLTSECDHALKNHSPVPIDVVKSIRPRSQESVISIEMRSTLKSSKLSIPSPSLHNAKCVSLAMSECEECMQDISVDEMAKRMRETSDSMSCHSVTLDQRTLVSSRSVSPDQEGRVDTQENVLNTHTSQAFNNVDQVSGSQSATPLQEKPVQPQELQQDSAQSIIFDHGEHEVTSCSVISTEKVEDKQQSMPFDLSPQIFDKADSISRHPSTTLAPEVNEDSHQTIQDSNPPYLYTLFESTRPLTCSVQSTVESLYKILETNEMCLEDATVDCSIASPQTSSLTSKNMSTESIKGSISFESPLQQRSSQNKETDPLLEGSETPFASRSVVEILPHSGSLEVARKIQETDSSASSEINEPLPPQLTEKSKHSLPHDISHGATNSLPAIQSVISDWVGYDSTFKSSKSVPEFSASTNRPVCFGESDFTNIRTSVFDLVPRTLERSQLDNAASIPAVHSKTAVEKPMPVYQNEAQILRTHDRESRLSSAEKILTLNFESVNTQSIVQEDCENSEFPSVCNELVPPQRPNSQTLTNSTTEINKLPTNLNSTSRPLPSKSKQSLEASEIDKTAILDAVMCTTDTSLIVRESISTGSVIPTLEVLVDIQKTVQTRSSANFDVVCELPTCAVPPSGERSDAERNGISQRPDSGKSFLSKSSTNSKLLRSPSSPENVECTSIVAHKTTEHESSAVVEIISSKQMYSLVDRECEPVSSLTVNTGRASPRNQEHTAKDVSLSSMSDSDCIALSNHPIFQGASDMQIEVNKSCKSSIAAVGYQPALLEELRNVGDSEYEKSNIATVSVARNVSAVQSRTEFAGQCESLISHSATSAERVLVETQETVQHITGSLVPKINETATFAPEISPALSSIERNFTLVLKVAESCHFLEAMAQDDVEHHRPNSHSSSNTSAGMESPKFVKPTSELQRSEGDVEEFSSLSGSEDPVVEISSLRHLVLSGVPNQGLSEDESQRYHSRTVPVMSDNEISREMQTLDNTTSSRATLPDIVTSRTNSRTSSDKSSKSRKSSDMKIKLDIHLAEKDTSKKGVPDRGITHTEIPTIVSSISTTLGEEVPSSDQSGPVVPDNATHKISHMADDVAVSSLKVPEVKSSRPLFRASSTRSIDADRSSELLKLKSNSQHSDKHMVKYTESDSQEPSQETYTVTSLSPLVVGDDASSISCLSRNSLSSDIETAYETPLTMGDVAPRGNISDEHAVSPQPISKTSSNRHKTDIRRSTITLIPDKQHPEMCTVKDAMSDTEKPQGPSRVTSYLSSAVVDDDASSMNSHSSSSLSSVNDTTYKMLRAMDDITHRPNISDALAISPRPVSRTSSIRSAEIRKSSKVLKLPPDLHHSAMCTMKDAVLDSGEFHQDTPKVTRYLSSAVLDDASSMNSHSSTSLSSVNDTAYKMLHAVDDMSHRLNILDVLAISPRPVSRTSSTRYIDTQRSYEVLQLTPDLQNPHKDARENDLLSAGGEQDIGIPTKNRILTPVGGEYATTMGILSSSSSVTSDIVTPRKIASTVDSSALSRVGTPNEVLKSSRPISRASSTISTGPERRSSMFKCTPPLQPAETDAVKCTVPEREEVHLRTSTAKSRLSAVIVSKDAVSVCDHLRTTSSSDNEAFYKTCPSTKVVRRPHTRSCVTEGDAADAVTGSVCRPDVDFRSPLPSPVESSRKEVSTLCSSDAMSKTQVVFHRGFVSSASRPSSGVRDDGSNMGDDITLSCSNVAYDILKSPRPMSRASSTSCAATQRMSNVYNAAEILHDPEQSPAEKLIGDSRVGTPTRVNSLLTAAANGNASSRSCVSRTPSMLSDREVPFESFRASNVTVFRNISNEIVKSPRPLSTVHSGKSKGSSKSLKSRQNLLPAEKDVSEQGPGSDMDLLDFDLLPLDENTKTRRVPSVFEDTLKSNSYRSRTPSVKSDETSASISNTPDDFCFIRPVTSDSGSIRPISRASTDISHIRSCVDMFRKTPELQSEQNHELERDTVSETYSVKNLAVKPGSKISLCMSGTVGKMCDSPVSSPESHSGGSTSSSMKSQKGSKSSKLKQSFVSREESRRSCVESDQKRPREARVQTCRVVSLDIERYSKPTISRHSSDCIECLSPSKTKNEGIEMQSGAGTSRSYVPHSMNEVPYPPILSPVYSVNSQRSSSRSSVKSRRSSKSSKLTESVRTSNNDDDSATTSEIKPHTASPVNKSMSDDSANPIFNVNCESTSSSSISSLEQKSRTSTDLNAVYPLSSPMTSPTIKCDSTSPLLGSPIEKAETVSPVMLESSMEDTPHSGTPEYIVTYPRPDSQTSTTASVLDVRISKSLKLRLPLSGSINESSTEFSRTTSSRASVAASEAPFSRPRTPVPEAESDHEVLPQSFSFETQSFSHESSCDVEVLDMDQPLTCLLPAREMRNFSLEDVAANSQLEISLMRRAAEARAASAASGGSATDGDTHAVAASKSLPLPESKSERSGVARSSPSAAHVSSGNSRCSHSSSSSEESTKAVRRPHTRSCLAEGGAGDAVAGNASRTNADFRSPLASPVDSRRKELAKSSSSDAVSKTQVVFHRGMVPWARRPSRVVWDKELEVPTDALRVADSCESVQRNQSEQPEVDVKSSALSDETPEDMRMDATDNVEPSLSQDQPLAQGDSNFEDTMLAPNVCPLASVCFWDDAISHKTRERDASSSTPLLPYSFIVQAEDSSQVVEMLVSSRPASSRICEIEEKASPKTKSHSEGEIIVLRVDGHMERPTPLKDTQMPIDTPHEADAAAEVDRELEKDVEGVEASTHELKEDTVHSSQNLKRDANDEETEEDRDKCPLSSYVGTGPVDGTLTRTLYRGVTSSTTSSSYGLLSLRKQSTSSVDSSQRTIHSFSQATSSSTATTRASEAGPSRRRPPCPRKPRPHHRSSSHSEESTERSASVYEARTADTPTASSSSPSGAQHHQRVPRKPWSRHGGDAGSRSQPSDEVTLEALGLGGGVSASATLMACVAATELAVSRDNPSSEAALSKTSTTRSRRSYVAPRPLARVAGSRSSLAPTDSSGAPRKSVSEPGPASRSAKDSRSISTKLSLSKSRGDADEAAEFFESYKNREMYGKVRMEKLYSGTSLTEAPSSLMEPLLDVDKAAALAAIDRFKTAEFPDPTEIPSMMGLRLPMRPSSPYTRSLRGNPYYRHLVAEQVAASRAAGDAGGPVVQRPRERRRHRRLGWLRHCVVGLGEVLHTVFTQCCE